LKEYAENAISAATIRKEWCDDFVGGAGGMAEVKNDNRVLYARVFEIYDEIEGDLDEYTYDLFWAVHSQWNDDDFAGEWDDEYIYECILYYAGNTALTDAIAAYDRGDYYTADCLARIAEPEFKNALIIAIEARDHYKDALKHAEGMFELLDGYEGGVE
jgi:hypothetical protein